MKYFFTFGSGHHDIHGQNLDGRYVCIEAEDELSARRIMFQHNGAKWAGCYTEERFLPQIDEYGYEEIGLWDIDVCCGMTQLEYAELLEKYNKLKRGEDDSL